MTVFFRGALTKLSSPLLLTFIFFVFSLYFSLNHEMWRDEMQAWLIARDSHSVFDLIENAKYEGHPILWYLLLMISNRVFSSPISMQILHLILATATVFIFLKYSPFSSAQKVLFIFGYYPFYEYSVISRNYGIGLFLIFVYCALLKNRLKYIAPIGLTLFFLAQTNIFGLIISLAALTSLAIELAMDFKSNRDYFKNWKIYFGFGIAIAGILASMWEMFPPPDSGFAKEWFFILDKTQFQSALSAFSNAFFPLPTLEQHYWNTTNWSITFSAYVFAPLAIGVCLSFARSIKNNIPVLCFFVLSLMGIAIFFYVKYLGYWRHQGYLYIAFIAAIWLARDGISAGPTIALQGVKGTTKTFNSILNFILVVHVVGALFAFIGESRYPFSSGRATAEYLKANYLLAKPIVAFPDDVAPSVLGYLGEKNAFYPQAESDGSFIKWDRARLRVMEAPAAINAAKNQSIQLKQEVIFLTNAPLADGLAKKEGLVFLKGFEGAINRDENYYLYIIGKGN